jgi:hypothetical protein
MTSSSQPQASLSHRERCLAAGVPTDSVDALLEAVKRAGVGLDDVLTALMRSELDVKAKLR